MTESTPWPRRLTTIVGQRVKLYRETFRSGRLSASRLADLTEGLGHRVEPTVIANMESGRRSNITQAEILVLARALEVTPAQLQVPVGSEDTFPTLPDEETHPWAAFRWLTSDTPEFNMVGPGSSEYALAVNAYRRHDVAMSKYVTAYLGEEGASNPELADAYLDSLVNVRAEIRSRGWSLPELVGWKSSSNAMPSLQHVVEKREAQLDERELGGS